MTFDEADKVIHPVETQWHYPILTAAGYLPNTLSATGFVRRYIYTHPATCNVIAVSTGMNIDYWTDNTTKQSGYWATLESHLAKKAVALEAV